MGVCFLLCTPDSIPSGKQGIFDHLSSLDSCQERRDCFAQNLIPLSWHRTAEMYLLLKLLVFICQIDRNVLFFQVVFLLCFSTYLLSVTVMSHRYFLKSSLNLFNRTYLVIRAKFAR